MRPADARSLPSGRRPARRPRGARHPRGARRRRRASRSAYSSIVSLNISSLSRSLAAATDTAGAALRARRDVCAHRRAVDDHSGGGCPGCHLRVREDLLDSSVASTALVAAVPSALVRRGGTRRRGGCAGAGGRAPYETLGEGRVAAVLGRLVDACLERDLTSTLLPNRSPSLLKTLPRKCCARRRELLLDDDFLSNSRA